MRDFELWAGVVLGGYGMMIVRYQNPDIPLLIQIAAWPVSVGVTWIVWKAVDWLLFEKLWREK